MAAPASNNKVPELFTEKKTVWSIPQTKPVPSKNWDSYNLGSPSILVTWFYITQAFKNETRSIQDSWIQLVTSVGYTYQGVTTALLWDLYLRSRILLWEIQSAPWLNRLQYKMRCRVNLNTPLVIPLINFKQTLGNGHHSFHKYLYGCQHIWHRWF